jgi:hypothetical protein
MLELNVVVCVPAGGRELERSLSGSVRVNINVNVNVSVLSKFHGGRMTPYGEPLGTTP